LFDRASLVTI